MPVTVKYHVRESLKELIELASNDVRVTG
jgi:hypothetical protein